MTMPAQDSGWGGRRLGREGQSYGQRTDLNTGPRAAPAAPGSPAPQGTPAWTGPDETPNLMDPSADSRPVTDGLDVGPGAGSSALAEMPMTAPDQTLLALQVMLKATGSDHIRRLIARYDRGRGL